LISQAPGLSDQGKGLSSYCCVPSLDKETKAQGGNSFAHVESVGRLGSPGTELSPSLCLASQFIALVHTHTSPSGALGLPDLLWDPEDTGGPWCSVSRGLGVVSGYLLPVHKPSRPAKPAAYLKVAQGPSWWSKTLASPLHSALFFLFPTKVRSLVLFPLFPFPLPPSHLSRPSSPPSPSFVLLS
jgi:hypothetical protein